MKSVRMPTVWLPMCSTGAPMARAGGGNIPGNNLGQGFTSPSTFTHVPGAYGARMGAVGGAADRRLTVTFGERRDPSSSSFMLPLLLRHSLPPTECRKRCGSMNGEELGSRRSPKRCYRHISTSRLANDPTTHATSPIFPERSNALAPVSP